MRLTTASVGFISAVTLIACGGYHVHLEPPEPGASPEERVEAYENLQSDSITTTLEMRNSNAKTITALHLSNGITVLDPVDILPLVPPDSEAAAAAAAYGEVRSTQRMISGPSYVAVLLGSGMFLTWFLMEMNERDSGPDGLKYGGLGAALAGGLGAGVGMVYGFMADNRRRHAFEHYDIGLRTTLSICGSKEMPRACNPGEQPAASAAPSPTDPSPGPATAAPTSAPADEPAPDTETDAALPPEYAQRSARVVEPERPTLGGFAWMPNKPDWHIEIGDRPVTDLEFATALAAQVDEPLSAEIREAYNPSLRRSNGILIPGYILSGLGIALGGLRWAVESDDPNERVDSGPILLGVGVLGLIGTITYHAMSTRALRPSDPYYVLWDAKRLVNIYNRTLRKELIPDAESTTDEPDKQSKEKRPRH